MGERTNEPSPGADARVSAVCARSTDVVGMCSELMRIKNRPALGAVLQQADVSQGFDDSRKEGSTYLELMK